MSHSCNILIIDRCHPVLLEKLGAYNLRYEPDIALDELEEAIANAQVLILRSKLALNAEWLDKAVQLKLVMRLGSGMDNIDVDYAEEKGISCLNAPEGNRAAVAEQTIAMAIGLLANISKSHQEMREGRWTRSENTGLELGALTVGIVGYGNVGTALADRLSAFGCRILAYDLFKSDFGSEHVQEVGLEEIKSNADIICLHVPLNKWSYWMIDDEFIESVSRPFYLLNLSRGDVVKTDSLIAGLKSGKIRGLGLDVFENEKPETHTAMQAEMFAFLHTHSRVIFTPHIGGLTLESFQKTSAIAADKLLEKLASSSFC